jgi:twitching motility protein PilT
MIATDAIRNHIREGTTHQIATTIESSGRLGMQTMDRAIEELFKKGKISREVAMLNCHKTDDMRRKIGA